MFLWNRHIRILIIIVILQINSAIFPQSYNIGPIRLSGENNAPLQINMSSLSSYEFLRRVGGINFSSIAIIDFDTNHIKLEIDYSAFERDGKRLLFKINGKRIYYDDDLYDWQLIPIAKYANSDYTACVTLFGENTDSYAFEIKLHEAFQNTLLGLRLIQADIILMAPHKLWPLPKLSGKNRNFPLSNYNDIPLGRGEYFLMPDSSKNDAIGKQLNKILDDDTFESWVLTCDSTAVHFFVHYGLKIIGEPFYYFWNVDEDKLKDTLHEIIEYQNQRFLQAEGPVLREKILKETQKIIKNIYVRDMPTAEVHNTTYRIRNEKEKIQELNPAVYDAVLKTMRYSAFFRYFKLNSPKNWNSFFNKIRTIIIEPNVTTPTMFYKHGPPLESPSIQTVETNVISLTSFKGSELNQNNLILKNLITVSILLTILIILYKYMYKKPNT